MEPDVLMERYEVHDLDRADSILSTSPIRELGIASMATLRLVSRILQFDHARLVHLKQLVLHRDVAVELRRSSDSIDQMADVLAAQCVTRRLSRLIMHDDNRLGVRVEPCPCCS